MRRARTEAADSNSWGVPFRGRSCVGGNLGRSSAGGTQRLAAGNMRRNAPGDLSPDASSKRIASRARLPAEEAHSPAVAGHRPAEEGGHSPAEGHSWGRIPEAAARSPAAGSSRGDHSRPAAAGAGHNSQAA